MLKLEVDILFIYENICFFIDIYFKVCMFILFILIDVEESFNFDVCILCGWFDYGLK